LELRLLTLTCKLFGIILRNFYNVILQNFVITMRN